LFSPLANMARLAVASKVTTAKWRSMVGVTGKVGAARRMANSINHPG
jgi:hypothetical protein